MSYSVWFVPTEEGIKAFGWARRAVETGIASHDDAAEVAYLHDCYDQAPDRYRYRNIIIQHDQD